MARRAQSGIESADEIITPAALRRELPLAAGMGAAIAGYRNTIEAIIDGADPRLLAIVGPCSIHDIAGATEFAKRLSALAHELSDSLFIVMRVYFEKPRGITGWSGLITDPFLDGGFHVPEGLRAARKFLSHLARMDMPAATEILHPWTPAYLGDLFAWSAIGQRAAESNTHRNIASGLGMPVGFKNAPRAGGIETAIKSIREAARPHAYLGTSENGALATILTRGNDYAHLVLRGGDGYGFGGGSVGFAEKKLAQNSLPARIVVDCSHANSEDDPHNQEAVLRDLLTLIESGNTTIIGFMLESYLEWGAQPITADPDKMDYGVSVTDPCIDWDTTERLLREAADRHDRILSGN